MTYLLRLSACLTILLSLNAFAVDTDEDGFEPNNNSNQATIILPGTTQTHSIDPAADEDWLEFTIQEILSLIHI